MIYDIKLYLQSPTKATTHSVLTAQELVLID